MSVHPNPSQRPPAPPVAGMVKPRKGRTPLPANETEAEQLKRLAKHRVSSAIKRIRLVGNLANYNPTEEQAKAILSALDQEVTAVERRLLSKGTAKVEPTFTLG